MKTTFKTVLIFLLIALPVCAMAAPMEIPEGSRCFQCGMEVEPGSAFSAEFVRDGEMFPFCDIGDMLYQYTKEDEKPSELYVRDNQSGKWIDATRAAFVQGDDFETPMGWGIAAFANPEEAMQHGNPMTFEEAVDSIR